MGNENIQAEAMMQMREEFDGYAKELLSLAEDAIAHQEHLRSTVASGVDLMPVVTRLHEIANNIHQLSRTFPARPVPEVEVPQVPDLDDGPVIEDFNAPPSVPDMEFR